ncbi:PepSY domain-containing protein [Maricaulis sp. CAU 1757]
MTTLLRWTVRVHKWVALAVGIQIVLWVMGGVVMSVLPLEQVRGEHNMAVPPEVSIDAAQVLPLTEALRQADFTAPLRQARLETWLDRPVWRVVSSGGLPVMIDAATGARLSPVDETTAMAVARADYLGEDDIASVEYLAAAPREAGGGGPVWRVTMDDGEETRLYVSPDTGLIAARRNASWRFFDFFWMLHIMDYEERENFNNPLLITASLLALLTVLAGFLLLILRMQRLVRMEMAKARMRRSVGPNGSSQSRRGA